MKCIHVGGLDGLLTETGDPGRSAAARGLEESFGSVSAVLEGEGDTARFEVLRRMVDDQEKEKTLLIGKVKPPRCRPRAFL